MQSIREDSESDASLSARAAQQQHRHPNIGNTFELNVCVALWKVCMLCVQISYANLLDWWLFFCSVTALVLSEFGFFFGVSRYISAYIIATNIRTAADHLHDVDDDGDKEKDKIKTKTTHAGDDLNAK